MDPIDTLASLFERFPGIGPRQARRFVQYVMRSPSLRRELVGSLQGIGGSVATCALCMRFHSGRGKVCSICASDTRDARLLAVVASDADLSALESSGTYRGNYFVLGGTISLANDKADGLRIRQLLDSLPSRAEKGLEEVVLAFPANPEGDATAARVRDEILGFVNPNLGVRVTALGRGLSTGSELEYADPETIKNALEGRR